MIKKRLGKRIATWLMCLAVIISTMNLLACSTIKKNAFSKEIEAEIGSIADQIYTGEAITPELSVTAGGLNLVKGTDYVCSYSNNKSVGTATVSVTFIDKYVDLGTVEKTFNIIWDCVVTQNHHFSDATCRGICVCGERNINGNHKFSKDETDNLDLYQMHGMTDIMFETGTLRYGEQEPSTEYSRTTGYISAGRYVRVDGTDGINTYIVVYDSDFNYVDQYRASEYAPYGKEYVRIVVKTQEESILEGIKISITGYNSEFQDDIVFNFGMITKWCHIGDSYGSGHIYLDPDDKSTGVDNYEVSWPQVVGRMMGQTVYNSAIHGLSVANEYSSTKTWWENESRGREYMEALEPLPLYVITLGGNDDNKNGTGNEFDMYDDSSTSFYGYYGRMIRAIQNKSPNAMIVLTSTSCEGVYDKEIFNAAIRNIAEEFGLPFIDWTEDEYMCSQARLADMIQKHPSEAGYEEMANAFIRLFDECVSRYRNYFADHMTNEENDKFLPKCIWCGAENPDIFTEKAYD